MRGYLNNPRATAATIADVAVMGVHHDAEEVPKAFVVRRAARPGLDAEEVHAFVAARVAPYKKARLVEFLERRQCLRR
ncbi:AMP-binding enzyme [Streptomyces mirabilis]|uniref:AMP-binding enzyme n=1 Tax=Streptomyces mirabilis TaxID=68239 RepID=UPI0036A68CA5